MLQDGAWRKLTSIRGTHPHFVPLVQRHVLVDSKIYITSLNILVLDLLASSFSIIPHPQGVEYRGIVHTKLSPPDDDSGVYLIHANELQLDIWLHKKDKWSLLNIICLKHMLANLRMTDPTFENDHTGVVLINQVGNNVEFVFWQMGRSVLYLDTKCRTLCKVHWAGRDGILLHIHPFFL
uniref:Uncharacterized protein n=1 Tax=Avena sativa TaxID=4498 RepID=A0ACD5VAC3_AVESA